MADPKVSFIQRFHCKSGSLLVEWVTVGRVHCSSGLAMDHVTPLFQATFPANAGHPSSLHSTSPPAPRTKGEGTWMGGLKR